MITRRQSQLRQLLADYSIAELPRLADLKDEISCTDANHYFANNPANVERLRPVTTRFIQHIRYRFGNESATQE
jgi:hypothetical protein